MNTMRNARGYPVLVLACAILFFAPFGLRAQKKEKQKSHHAVTYIKLDYLQDTSDVYKRTATFESSVGVRIININKKLFNITNEVSSATYNAERPAAFSIFDGTALPTAEPSDRVKGHSSVKDSLFEGVNVKNINPPFKDEVVTLHTTYQEIVAESDLLYVTLSAFVENYKMIKAAVDYHQTIEELSRTCNMEYKSIRNAFVTDTKDWLGGDEASLNTVRNDDEVSNLNKTDSVLLLRGIVKRYLNALLEQEERDFKTVKEKHAETSIEMLLEKIDVLEKNVNAMKLKVKGKGSNPAERKALNKIVNFPIDGVVKILNASLKDDWRSMKMLMSTNSMQTQKHLMAPVFLSCSIRLTHLQS